jgi:hypothetical protein
MKRNLKTEEMCRGNAHGTLVFLAFAQIKSAATSPSFGSLLSISPLSIYRLVVALPRASPAPHMFGPVC